MTFGEKSIRHYDPGGQYRIKDHQQQLRRNEIDQFMARKGNCLGNAAMESFFAVLKSELYHPNQFADIQGLQSELAIYIGYDNDDRI